MLAIMKYFFLLCAKPRFALALRKLFDGIAECGARHGVSAGLEPKAELICVALASFAEEPAHGLLDEIVFVVEKDLSYGVCIGCLAMADELHGAYHSYALFPDVFAVTGQII